jgi:hypothetical protein
MAKDPRSSAMDPAEGSREVIEHELERGPAAENTRVRPAPVTARPAEEPLAPGDEAAPGTPGTGEDVCPRCNGTGEVARGPCPHCRGTGRIVRGIGGA